MPSLGTHGCTCHLLKGGRDILTLAFPSIAPFVWLTFQLQHYHFLLPLSSLLAKSLFCLPVFVKCHVSLTLWDRESTQGHTLQSVWEPKGSTVTNHGQTLKEVMWSLIMMCVCRTCGDWQTVELAACKYRHSQFKHRHNWNSNPVIWSSLTLVTETHAYQNQAKQMLSLCNYKSR